MERLKVNEIEFCLTNLMDIIELCANKKICRLGKERIYVKAGSIYETLKNTLSETRKKEW